MRARIRTSVTFSGCSTYASNSALEVWPPFTICTFSQGDEGSANAWLIGERITRHRDAIVQIPELNILVGERCSADLPVHPVLLCQVNAYVVIEDTQPDLRGFIRIAYQLDEFPSFQSYDKPAEIPVRPLEVVLVHDS